jgi:hypothetical protein
MPQLAPVPHIQPVPPFITASCFMLLMVCFTTLSLLIFFDFMYDVLMFNIFLQPVKKPAHSCFALHYGTHIYWLGRNWNETTIVF